MVIHPNLENPSETQRLCSAGKRACLPWLPLACFSRWTRSGGPSSRKDSRESVRASIDSWITSSVSLWQGVRIDHTRYSWTNVLGNRRRDHDDGWQRPVAKGLWCCCASRLAGRKGTASKAEQEKEVRQDECALGATSPKVKGW
jgi:hypothetical protein